MLRGYLGLPNQVYLLCLGTLINRAGTLVIVFLSRYLQTRLDVGTDFATMTIGVFGFGSLFAGLLGGFLADRIGRKPVMLIALFGSTAILLVFAELTSPVTVLAATFGFGLVGDMYRPAASAMIADLVEPERRSHAFGLMFFCINLGFSVAPFLGGWLAERSYTWLFRVDGLTAAAYGLLIVVLVRETLGRESAGQEAESAVGWRESLRTIIDDRVFLVYVGAMLFCIMVYSQHLSTFPIYTMNRGISEVQYGELIAINGIMIVALQLPVTSFVQRFHRMSVIMFGAVLIGFGYWLNLFAVSWGFFALTVMVWTLGELVQAPFLMAIPGDLAPKRLRGSYMGVFGMSFAMSLTIGAPLGGWVLDRLGPRVLWWSCLGVGVLAAVLLATVYRAIGRAGGRPGADAGSGLPAGLCAVPEPGNMDMQDAVIDGNRSAPEQESQTP